MIKAAVLSFLFAATFAAYYEDTVDIWVNRINKGRSSFKAGYNPYLKGKSLESMKRLMGTRMDRKSRTKAKVLREGDPKATYPTTFTTGVDKWANCKSTVSFIKDQADCGSCWAVAASEVIADRTCIGNYASISRLNENPPAISMSAAQIMDCCYWCGDGCQGGYPIDAMKYWAWTGVVTGGWYGSNCGCKPYGIPPCPSTGCSGPEADTPPCEKSCIPGYGVTFTNDKHQGTDHYEIEGASAIQKEIYNKGSVECAFEVYENFMHYTSGVYDQIEGQYLGGHAVKVIGWGHENGEDYWLINNSWNVTWGLNGQFKFLRGTDLAGMESQCVAGMANTADSNFKLVCL